MNISYFTRVFSTSWSAYVLHQHPIRVRGAPEQLQTLLDFAEFLAQKNAQHQPAQQRVLGLNQLTSCTKVLILKSIVIQNTVNILDLNVKLEF